jgi:hypothetical protein
MSSSVDPAHPVELASLGSRLSHPQRPRVAEARAAVHDAATGDQAWQRLYEHGLLAGDLLRSPTRRFAVVDTERRPAAAGDDQLDAREAPATVDAAVTLASDAANVLEAEQLARTLRTRLVPWGAHPVERIEWIVVTHRIPFSFRQGPAFNCALYSLEHALEDIDVELGALRADLPGLPPFVNDVIRGSEGWAMAVRESLEVPNAFGPPPALVGTPFEALDNPFDTALRLWALGYALDHLRDDDRAPARLFTAVIDAPQNLPARLRDQASTGSA